MITAIIYIYHFIDIYDKLFNYFLNSNLKDFDSSSDLFGLEESKIWDDSHFDAAITTLFGLLLIGLVDSLIYGFLRSVF